jgi:glycosyltransferase involved in cell wall biosynthesis
VLGEERTLVLYNYLDRDLFAPDLKGVASSAKTAEFDENPQFTYRYKRYDLIYCGLLTQKRGAWKLLEAIRELKPRIPELKVLLLGKIDPPGLQEEMQSFIRRHDLNHTIEIKGQVPHEQVGKYYRSSRIGLLLWQPVSSLKIKMPIKLFEYMAFGLPVIGSNFGHIADLIEKESCGIAVDPENPEEVAEAIESLMRQEKIYNSMSSNGIEAGRDKYNWKIEFDRLCNQYKKALDER